MQNLYFIFVQTKFIDLNKVFYRKEYEYGDAEKGKKFCH